MSGSRDKQPSVGTPTPSVMAVDDHHTTPTRPTVKTVLPDTYNGDRSKLTAFLGQVELYMAFNRHRFLFETGQVLFIITLLRGAAFDWISPFLMDCAANETLEGRVSTVCKKETRKLFMTVGGFGEGIRQVFGDIEEERSAERSLQHLTQRGSAANYTADFQSLAARTKWDEAALQARYYQGLKDKVKDEIARSEKPDDLQEMIQLAVKIDNRLYERTLEKKGQYSNRLTGHHSKGTAKYHSPMELDATIKRKTPCKEVMDERRKKGLCFECGLPGHRASSHKNKKGHGKPRQVNATGRGGYNANKKKQICALQRTHPKLDLNDEDLEELQVNTLVVGGFDGTPWEENSDEPESEESESEELVFKKGDRKIISEWPKGWPIKGDIWMVHKREVRNDATGIREWVNLRTNKVWKEPGLARAGGPERMTVWKVVYQDHKRIGWRQEEGTGTFMWHSPAPPIQQQLPTEGQLWQLLVQGNRDRFWRQVENENRYFEEKLETGSTKEGFQSGEVYRLIHKPEDPREPWVWINILHEYDFPPQILKSEVKREAAKFKNQVAATLGEGQLIVQIKLNGLRTTAMLDTGATGNFIHPRTIHLLGLTTTVKELEDVYQLSTVNGQPANEDGGWIDVETEPLCMTFPGKHTEIITLDVVDIAKHRVILGMPWMKEHNPQIDWKSRTISFERCTHEKAGQPDTGISFNTNESEWDTEDTNNSDLEEVCATSQKESGYLEDKEDPLLKQIPEAYHEFLNMFRKKEGTTALPEHTSDDHEIPLKDGREPPFLPIYQMSETDLATVRKYVDDMLAKGFIRESRSPAGAPVLLADKPDGTKRFCVDYRKLNDMTIKDRYALPLADELRDRLGKAKIFTKLDLRDAYHLIRIKEGEEWKTAWRCRYGHYEYLVMPYGLTNAPATCMRLINRVLQKYLDKICICYMDDILIYSQNEKLHTHHVRVILRALQDAKLQCKPEKCDFSKTEVTFLGYVVNLGGISMDLKKVSAVTDWTTPTCVKDVQSFLGFANFYRRFIRNYSKITAPLTNLTKKDQPFSWTDEAQQAFDALKTAFTQAPMLLTFDPSKDIVVETDSSDYALGAVLSQPGKDDK
jgi:reverse transcriptase-like protein/uncharacterized protein DUF4939/aspartyl protease